MRKISKNIFFSLLLFLFCHKASGLGKKLFIEPEKSKVYLNSGEFKKYYLQGDNVLMDNQNKAFRIALELQRIAIKRDKAELTFLANYFLARCYYFFNDAAKAIKIFESLNRMAIEKKWIESEIKINTYLGSTFQLKRNYGLAQKHYLKGLKIAKKNNKLTFMLDIYEKLGFANIASQQDSAYTVANDYFQMGLKLAIELKDSTQIAIYYTRIGMLGDNGTTTSNSANTIHKGLSILRKIKNKEELFLAYKALGDLYYNTKQNDSSLYYYIEVFKLHKINGYARLSATSACDVGYMYGETGNIDLLNKYADTAVYYSRKDKSFESRYYVAKWLGDIYRKLGKYDVAVNHYKYLSHILDSTLKSGNSEVMVSAGLQSEFDSKLEIIKLNQEKEREIRQKEKENQTFLARLYLIAFFIALIFLLIIFREFRINRKQKIIISQQHENVSSQKIILEIKNKEITDSINYALRIQSALLPNPDELFKLLNGSFLYYAPKDIVSGDFYWFYKRNDEIYIACGDCTGHGVPGALMSVLGINLLSDIVDGKKESEPAKILDLLRIGIIKSLNKDNEAGLYKDGMDLSLVKINAKKMTCVFAGANNPIYHISNGSLLEYKASSQPIGFSHKQEPFAQTEFTIAKSDYLILFTDGFADQFGGDSNKKFMYKRFKEILIQSISKNEKNVDTILKSNFTNWKGQVEQIDDVCVLGIKV